jgi:UDP-N-acetylglucosamine 4,6-dehydratase
MKNKVILITGSGFLATQLIKDILPLDPQSIRIFSRSESRQAKLKAEINDNRLRFLIGDIRDYGRLNRAMEGVDICINTAALKRIDTCQDNVLEAVETNVKGVINCVESALYRNIECLLQVSTDKAMLPETTYGASKYLAEEIVNHAITYRGTKRTKFKVVRYGNVLGSTGSVIPIWQEQFKNNQPITVRHKEMTRFFMTVQQASKLVLDTIISGQEGKVHSLPMDSINIYELAKYLYPNSEIKITGLSHAEKINEDLYEGYNSKDHLVSPEIILKGAKL